MALFDARRPDALSHGGTFNGNPVAAAAGLATLRELTPARYEDLERLGDRLRARVPAATGIGSLFQVASPSPAELYLGLLLDGFLIAPRGMGAIATPTTPIQKPSQLSLSHLSGRPSAVSATK